MADDISKVVPFWEWKEKQKAIDDEANGGVPLLRSKDWYHREYGKYVAAIQRQGYASFNKGTLTVDVGQFLKDTRIESATTPAEVDFARPVAQVISGGVNWTDAEPADFSYLYSSADYATLARQLAEARALAYVMPDDPEHGLLTWKERTYEESARAEQAESQLAEATRRLGEVEGLLREWSSWYAGDSDWIETLLARTDAAIDARLASDSEGGSDEQEG